MIRDILEVVAYVLFAFGGFLIFTGAVGMMRFPDFYTRTHAACLADSMGTVVIIVGVLLVMEPSLLMVKVLLLLLFMLITNATIAHALTKAALTDIIPLGTKLSKPKKPKKKA